MTLLRYLKDRAIPLLIIIIGLALVVIMLVVFGVFASGIISITVLLVLCLFAALLWDYLTRRRFYSELDSVLEQMEETFYITEALSRPAFSEGRLTYDALELGTKHMNDRISSYRISSVDYQEYIETWIHEIKTPLAASRLIIENNQKEASFALGDELDRIESSIEQALYYSRSSAVEKDYAIRSVNLEKLVKNVIRKQSKSLIAVHISPQLVDLDVDVLADAKWLDFIVGQIVANAAKYHNPNKHKRDLIVSAQCSQQGFDNKKVVLSIFDNGIGISQADVGRVFDKGFTGENGRTYAKSTGIGLYLCKKLCDRMKLTLSIESAFGQGTTVFIEFPLNKMYFLE